MKTMFRALLVGLIALTLCGCASSTKKEDAHTLMQADVLDQAKAAVAAPLFKLTCPATGCIIASLEVANPAAAAQMAEVMRVAMTPQPSPGLQAFVATMDAVKSLGAIGLVAHGVTSVVSSIVGGQVQTASAGFSALSSTAGAGFTANSSIASLIPQPITTTTTIGGNGTVGSGTTTTSPTTTTTSTSTTNTNSGNRTCTGGQAGNGAGTTTGGAGGAGGGGTC